MVQYKNSDKIQLLFGDWEESMLWSFFQGIMGKAFVNDVQNPVSAIVYVNCFAFAAGVPDEALVQEWYDREVDSFAIITAREEEWNRLFEKVGKEKCRRVERYAIKKEKDVFDSEKLETIVQTLSKEFVLKQIDQDIYRECMKYDWSIDFVQGYESYEQFEKFGLGVVAFCGDEMVAGASSYSSFENGIEIEIDTREDYRRRGLATACGAKLILECLKRGWYPSWDAQNKWSVALAEKLGYHYSHTYTAYEMWK